MKSSFLLTLMFQWSFLIHEIEKRTAVKDLNLVKVERKIMGYPYPIDVTSLLQNSVQILW